MNSKFPYNSKSVLLQNQLVIYGNISKQSSSYNNLMMIIDLKTFKIVSSKTISYGKISNYVDLSNPLQDNEFILEAINNQLWILNSLHGKNETQTLIKLFRYDRDKNIWKEVNTRGEIPENNDYNQFKFITSFVKRNKLVIYGCSDEISGITSKKALSSYILDVDMLTWKRNFKM